MKKSGGLLKREKNFLDLAEQSPEALAVSVKTA